MRKGQISTAKSLLSLATGRAPFTVSTAGDNNCGTIVWLDHRAMKEAEESSATGHKVLNYMGGAMLPEMEVPKLMWLKRNLRATWENAGYAFDFTDFLRWKASG